MASRKEWINYYTLWCAPLLQTFEVAVFMPMWPGISFESNICKRGAHHPRCGHHQLSEVKHYIIQLPPEVGLFQCFCDSRAHTNKKHFQMALKDQVYAQNNALWFNASLQKHHHLSLQYFTALCQSHVTRHDVPCQVYSIKVWMYKD